MGKFDERALRMRKERIDLFGDKSVTAIISRPERRPLSYREAVPGLAADIANAKPPKLCFDIKCTNEVHDLNVYMFVATDPDAAPLGMAACEACSKKSDEEILDILRTEFAKQFGIDPTKPASVVGTHFAEMGTEQTVHGIKLAIVDGIRGEPCPQAMIFSELLERRALPRFVFAFRGHNNCIAITNQLYLDLRDLGIENRFTFKEGSSSSLKSDGEPIGLHRWVELEGWVIDGSGGAFGNPVLFQRAEDYYRARQMTDIHDVTREPDDVPLGEAPAA
jgi:hypothetical protein